MKKSTKFLPFFIICFLFTSNNMQSQAKVWHSFADSISFTIKNIEVGYRVPAGQDIYDADKGSKLILITVSLKNNYNSKQTVNLNNFRLTDKGMKHRALPYLVNMPMKITMLANTKTTIKSNKTKSRILIFVVPKNEKSRFLEVNKNYIDIIYPE